MISSGMIKSFGRSAFFLGPISSGDVTGVGGRTSIEMAGTEQSLGLRTDTLLILDSLDVFTVVDSLSESTRLISVCRSTTIRCLL
jgi:hypothetical protein